MKRLILIIFLLIPMLNAMAQRADLVRYSAIQARSLVGPVRTIETFYGTGADSLSTYTEFDREGETITVRFNGKPLDAREDLCPVTGSEVYTREEESRHCDVTQKIRHFWLFDKNGRVLRHFRRYSTISTLVERYIYEKDEARLPSRIIVILSEEYAQSVSIEDYTYLEYDQSGNWTKREVEITTYIDTNQWDEADGPAILQEYDKRLETAQYTYWD